MMGVRSWGLGVRGAALAIAASVAIGGAILYAQQDGAAVRVAAGYLRCAKQSVDGRLVEGVPPLGAVQRPAVGRPGALHEEAFAHGRFRARSRSNLTHSTTTRECRHDAVSSTPFLHDWQTAARNLRHTNQRIRM